jgi:hypothetical protein
LSLTDQVNSCRPASFTLHPGKQGHFAYRSRKTVTDAGESNLRDKLASDGVQSADTAAGADLAKMAFDRESGHLAPPWDVAAESLQGVHLMLRGFFLWIRNGFHHHAHILADDKDGALELLQLCNALVKIVEKSRRR